MTNRATARIAAAPPSGGRVLHRAGMAVIVALGVLAFAQMADVAGPAGVGPGTASKGGEAAASWPEFMAIVAVVLLFVIIIVRVTLAAEARERD